MASTVELTVDTARAVNDPDAVIVDAPLTATSATTVALSVTIGMIGSGFVTLEISVALASSVTFAPAMLALLTLSVALTVGAMPVSGIASVPSDTFAFSRMSAAVSVMPGLSAMLSAFTVRFAVPRLMLLAKVTESLPPPPLIVNKPVIEPNDWLSNVPFALRTRIPAPPSSTTIWSPPAVPFTVTFALAPGVSTGSSPAYVIGTPSSRIVPASGPVADETTVPWSPASTSVSNPRAPPSNVTGTGTAPVMTRVSSKSAAPVIRTLPTSCRARVVVTPLTSRTRSVPATRARRHARRGRRGRWSRPSPRAARGWARASRP